ncbi:hypothetical protein QBC37DRAFT_259870, partial [Rhypophila decipiens]
FIGSPGYARGFISRDGGPFQNSVWLIPPAPRGVIYETDKIINPSLSKLTDQMYSEEFPMLKVAPGDWVAFMYLENGHVSKQDLPGGNPKPINRGTVYVYATYENDVSNYNLVDVHLKWNRDGTGGDGKGKLVATRHFDDGQCYEHIPAEGDLEGITTFRMKSLNYSVEAIPCQTDIKIPEDAIVGKKLTHFWVWDWGTNPIDSRGLAVSPAAYNDSSVTTAEIYTSIVDYDIVDPCAPELGEVKGPTCKKAGKPIKAQFVKQPDILKSGIQAQMENLWMVEVPHAGFNVNRAKASKSNIPMAILIGVKDPVKTRLSPDKLMNSPANPAFRGGSGAENPPSPSVSSLPSSVSGRPTQSPKPSSPPGGGADEEGILTVTVTVPQKTVFVTST